MSEERHLSEKDVELLLAGVTVPEVQHHLRHCRVCREAWEAERLAHERLQQHVAWITAPEGFQERVMGALREKPSQHLIKSTGFHPAYALVLLSLLGASLGTVFLFGWSVYRWRDYWWPLAQKYAQGFSNEILALWGVLSDLVGIGMGLLFRPWLFGVLFLVGTIGILAFLVAAAIQRYWWTSNGWAMGD